MCLCSHPWATCQPDRSPVPVSGLGSPRESGWDAARVQKAAGFPGGALLGGPWCISPRLDSAPPRGFQVQPPGFKKTASRIVSVLWATSVAPKLFWKKDQPPSRTRLAVGLKVGAGRVVESGLWLWKATCFSQTCYAREPVSEVASWPKRTPVEVRRKSPHPVEHGFLEPSDFRICLRRMGGK